MKTTFLHGDLEEEIYMQQPEGFKETGKEDYVCLLKRSLYGLKQSPRQWYKQFDSFMVHMGTCTVSMTVVFILEYLLMALIYFLLYMLMTC